jgi:hypothetical protein
VIFEDLILVIWICLGFRDSDFGLTTIPGVLFMSTPAPPHSTNSLHPVRQQLDELDGLLQRMLELPVDPVTENSPTPTLAHPWGEGKQGPVEANGNPVIVETSRVEMTPPENGLADPSFSHFQFQLSDSGSQTVAATDFTGLGSRPAADPRKPPPQTEEWEEEISVWLYPLVALNRAVDWPLFRLGRPGRWWLGAWGRTCLGLMGLLFLVGAFVWGILDWMQWSW